MSLGARVIDPAGLGVIARARSDFMMRDLTEKPALEDWWPWLLTFVSGRGPVTGPHGSRQVSGAPVRVWA